MKTYLECIPCFFKQALFAAREATNDERKIKQVLDAVGSHLPEIPLDSPPPQTARTVYGVIREITGVSDPFKKLKEESIRAALRLYPKMKALVEGSDDPLFTATRIAIAGNVIDFGSHQHFDLEEEMKTVLEKPLSINHFDSFKHAIENARTILCLGDNAGETVFDRILIETMGKDTIYAVRDIPIINDATTEDARNSGSLDVPIHLRNAPTKLMKELGYGKQYRYAHDEPDAYAAGERYFPEELGERVYYHPVQRGLEIKIAEKLAQLRELDKKKS